MAEQNKNKSNDGVFTSYGQYMESIFSVVNGCIDEHLEEMEKLYTTGQGQFKNVLYPDIEVAHDVCRQKLYAFREKENELYNAMEQVVEMPVETEEIDDELLELLGSFSDTSFAEAQETKAPILQAEKRQLGSLASDEISPAMRIENLNNMAENTIEAGVELPFYQLCKSLGFDYLTQFTFACGIMSSTQTDYASVFQIINENGNFACPTIESAAKLFYGKDFIVNDVFGNMSICLEQLLPIMYLPVQVSMPFSTPVSPDKRLIDFLFGKDPIKLDESYARYYSLLYNGKDELTPIMANQSILDAMEIAYQDGCRIFAYFGDEGSGRKFFIKHFCSHNGFRAISLNCKKLFAYSKDYVDKVLWALTRECILTNSCCVLEELQYREDTKEIFFDNMDLAFSKLTGKNVLVFANSKDDINYKEVTKQRITTLTLPTPSNGERLECWRYFSESYELSDECSLEEMTSKFLFTPGKVSSALEHAKSLSMMAKEDKISRDSLFKGCNAQMSSELSQKASRVDAKFGLDDIVMNKDQRETIMHVIEQMTYKKTVYEDWNYTKKYPYGRGITVLLYGAPGTGKSMMAQVLAHELNLELYRVDISKVVDKYVGETEKSLSMIFREAKKCNVVLFFDECDTIFAKRSDDGGSNQSSNNNKTALLLQEMEAYDGVCVLATNYKHNIDPAFFRRMKYVIEFQFPNEDTRQMLWETTVPKTTKLGEDVDFRFIAERFEFAGGNIKNCILNAAFLAAADKTANGEVCMRHYLNAIKYEYVKTGKVFTRSDFEPFADEVFDVD